MVDRGQHGTDRCDLPFYIRFSLVSFLQLVIKRAVNVSSAPRAGHMNHFPAWRLWMQVMHVGSFVVTQDGVEEKHKRKYTAVSSAVLVPANVESTVTIITSPPPCWPLSSIAQKPPVNIHCQVKLSTPPHDGGMSYITLHTHQPHSKYSQTSWRHNSSATCCSVVGHNFWRERNATLDGNKWGDTETIAVRMSCAVLCISSLDAYILEGWDMT